jgi:hypothetical protein
MFAYVAAFPRIYQIILVSLGQLFHEALEEAPGMLGLTSYQVMIMLCLIFLGKLTVVAPGQEKLPLNSRDQERIVALLADDIDEAESPQKSKKKKGTGCFLLYGSQGAKHCPHMCILLGR